MLLSHFRHESGNAGAAQCFVSHAIFLYYVAFAVLAIVFVFLLDFCAFFQSFLIVYRRVETKGCDVRFTLCLAVLFFAVSCGKHRPDPDKPPLHLFVWGKNRGDVKGLLEKEGYLVSERTEFIRATVPESEGRDIMPDESPYQLTFYFQNDRLNIVQIQIRNSPDRTTIYEQNLKTAYKLAPPVLQKSLPPRTTEAGNQIKETHSLYDTGEVYIKLYKSQVEIAESRMEEVPDETDIMIYSRKENEGITAEGLLSPEEN